MRIRMKTLSASPAGALQRGKIYDLPDERARPLVDNGFATAVDEPARPRLRDGLRLKDKAPAPPAGPQEKPIEKRTLDELKAYAAEHGIELGEATLKADVLAVIQTAMVVTDE